MKKYKIISSICIILAITFTSYLPSLNNHFVNWDDDLLITQNKLVRDLSWEGIKNICKSVLDGNYYPLSVLSNAIEYQFFKLNPFIYHLDSLILHLLNCILVFWLILLLTTNNRHQTLDTRLTTYDSRLTTNHYPLITTFVTTILFGIHPINVQSVVWMAERRVLIYTFFFLSSVISYIYIISQDNKKTSQITLYILTIILFILSVTSKSVTVMLPFVLIMCNYLFTQQSNKNSKLINVLFLGIIVLGSISIVIIRFSADFFRSMNWSEIAQNIIIANYRLVFYITKILVPVKLSCLYPPAEWFKNQSPFIYFSSPVVVIFLIGLVVWSLRSTQKLFFGSIFFLVMTLPVLQLVPTAWAMLADHYMYIPALGLFYIAGEGVAWLYFKMTNDEWQMANRKWLLLVILVGIIGILSVLTWQRCLAWENSITLWNDVLKKYPYLSMAYHNRGSAYYEFGDFDKAITDFNTTLKLDAGYTESYYGLGNSYRRKNESEKAIANYNQALKLNPDFAEVYNNRGLVYVLQQKYDNAILDYTQAIKLVPDYANAYNNRGLVYMTKKQYNKAILDYTQAVNIDTNYVEAYFNRALVYYRKGEYGNSITDFTQVITFNPNDAESYYFRSLAYYSKKEYDKTLADIKKSQELGYQVDTSFIKVVETLLNINN